MAKGYRTVDRDQQFLLPPSMREWLPADDPVWLVISLVDRLDTSELHALRKTGGVGRRGYDPDMLLTLLIWGWAHGERSSRTLERLCHRDIAFRVICGGDPPDHATIARFRAQASPVMPTLFTQVLAACAQLGMGKVGVVALDGVKIASNASTSKNRTEKSLVKAREAEVAALRDRLTETARSADTEHAANDADDDDGQSVPDELLRSDRLARIDEALQNVRALNKAAEDRQSTPIDFEALEAKRAAEQTARDEFVAQWKQEWADGSRPPGVVPIEARVEVAEAAVHTARVRHQARIDRRETEGGRGPRPAPVEQARAVRAARDRLDKAHADTAVWQAERDAEQHAWEQRKQRILINRVTCKPHRPTIDNLGNITDPQSRPMPLRGGGWVQGYNCQAVTTADGLIIATSVGDGPIDAPTFIPMMSKAVEAAAVLAEHRPPEHHAEPDQIGTLLADAGYLSEENITATGPARLIATAKSHKLPRDTSELIPPADDASPIEKMTYNLATRTGKALYSQRSHIAETPFGHAKHNLRFRRFTSRGIDRAASEFAFHALVNNIVKAITGGHLATA
ncbi:Transposase [Gordonia malaquae]|nr:transposase [Gordonia malaquae]SEB50775.1 Transposase [Gordonia malaquae]SEC51054.1 Transposase [Gordonia malaquae]